MFIQSLVPYVVRGGQLTMTIKQAEGQEGKLSILLQPVPPKVEEKDDEAANILRAALSRPVILQVSADTADQALVEALQTLTEHREKAESDLADVMAQLEASRQRAKKATEEKKEKKAKAGKKSAVPKSDTKGEAEPEKPESQNLDLF